MSDPRKSTTEDVVEELRSLADKLENGEARLVNMWWEVGYNTPSEISVEYWDRDD